MFIKLVRIGKDAELKNINGKSLLNLSVAYDVGYGDNKKTQWLNLTMFGQQAEKLAQHLTKGKQIVIRAEDLHIEEYNGKSYLKATLPSIEFVSDGNRQQTEQQQPQRQPAAPARQAPPPAVSANYDDDDLPFWVVRHDSISSPVYCRKPPIFCR